MTHLGIFTRKDLHAAGALPPPEPSGYACFGSSVHHPPTYDREKLSPR
jgi:hypothetical protein